MLRFLSTLLLIYIVWKALGFVFRVFLRYWLKKNGGKAFHYSGSFGGPAGGAAQRPEGEIRVESFGGNRTKNPKTDTRLGEYVDFEEVK